MDRTTFPLVESVPVPEFSPFVGSLSTLVRRGTTPTSCGNLGLFLLLQNFAKKRVESLTFRVLFDFCFDNLVSTDFAARPVTGRFMLLVLLFLPFLLLLVREGSASPSFKRGESVETF